MPGSGLHLEQVILAKGVEVDLRGHDNITEMALEAILMVLVRDIDLT